MATSRTSSHELQRLLASVGSPLYFVDEQRTIVFANQALYGWLGVPVGDLVGRPCRYQSGSNDGLAATVDALCPPPEAFLGQRTTALICVPTGTGKLEQRRADFIPLPGDGDHWVGVIAMVAAYAPAAGDGTVDDFPQADQQSATSGEESRHLHSLVQQFHQEFGRWHNLERLAGKSPAMMRVREQIGLAATGHSTVLIVGLPGSGRQHIARTIHTAADQSAGTSQLSDGNGKNGVANQETASSTRTFVPVSCAVLPSEVLLSTIRAISDRFRRMFGERALNQRSPNEPVVTVLLIDVHRLPAEIQPEVVRWLDGRPPNLHVISTSVEPLESLAQSSVFRADLAQRLSTLVIHMPPMAERREDIPLLAQIFLEQLNGQGGKQLRGFSSTAMDRLCLYDWPGQIDELAAMIQHSFSQAEGFEITPADLPKQLQLAAEAARYPRQPPQPIDLAKFLARVESELIDRSLRLAKGNKSQAARLLGMTRQRLYRRMVQLGFDPGAEDVES